MNGRSARIPVYDFCTNARVPGEFTMIYPSDVVVVEGILVFYFPGIRNKFNLKLFVDTDADTRLARWILFSFVYQLQTQFSQLPYGHNAKFQCLSDAEFPEFS